MGLPAQDQEVGDIHPETEIATKVAAFKIGNFDLLDLDPKQEEAMRLLTDQHLSELLYGGAKGGGKSWLGCEWLLWSCLAYPETRWYVGRHFLKQIRESTLVTFRKVCKKHRIPPSWYHINDNEVTIKFPVNGSFIAGIELRHKPSDFEFDAFGSTEYTGGWVEEGGGVTFKAYDVGSLSIGRHLNEKYGIKAKMLITGNPARNWMYNLFYKPWTAGTLKSDRRFIQAFVTDNTKVDAGYKARLEASTGATRERLYKGNWDYDSDPLQLIENDAIDDLFENDYVRPDEKRKYLIIDVAMHGSDLLRLGVFYGDVLVDHEYYEKSGGADVLAAAKRMQARHQIRPSSILVDSDGVGAFMGGKGGFIPGAIMFHANASPILMPDDKVVLPDGRTVWKSPYKTLKDQCGYQLADDINEGEMWAQAVTTEREREMLAEELAQIKQFDVADDGPLKLKPKKLIAADIGRSPDFSDLFLMKKYFDLLIKSLPAHQSRRVA